MAGFYGLHLGNTNICLSSCKVSFDLTFFFFF